MINWVYYPRSDEATETAMKVIKLFKAAYNKIDSDSHTLNSNEVLSVISDGLNAAGFEVEKGKTSSKKIRVPVLFGLNGKLEKSFEADAYNSKEGFVVEVEAGRGVTNNQFLKDLFQACMMHEVYYLAIAVRNTYRENKNFDVVHRFIDTLYSSDRLKLPLKGILIIGY
jgi:hypothetical protein